MFCGRLWGALLGFEGSGRVVWVLVALIFWDGCVLGGFGCGYVENCTVDASIFVGDKLLSAIGGCLGTKSR